MEENKRNEPTEQDILMDRIIDSLTAKGNHYFAGHIDDYRFNAKVFSEGSKYGIDGGRVSKLWIQKTMSEFRHATVVNYDRGWDIKPARGKDKEMYESILRCLETMPTDMTD